MSNLNYAAPVVSRQSDRYNFMNTSISDEYTEAKKVPREPRAPEHEKTDQQPTYETANKLPKSAVEQPQVSDQTHVQHQNISYRQVGAIRTPTEYDPHAIELANKHFQESTLNSPEKFARYLGNYSTSQSYGYQISAPGYPNIEPSDKSQLSFRSKPTVSSVLRPQDHPTDTSKQPETTPVKTPETQEAAQTRESEEAAHSPTDERAKYATLGRETPVHTDTTYGPYRYAPMSERNTPPAKYLVQSDSSSLPAGVAGGRSASPSILNKFSVTGDNYAKEDKPQTAVSALSPPHKDQDIFLSKDSYVSVTETQQPQQRKALDHSDPFPFTLEFKPIADPTPTVEVSPVSEAGYFSFSPLKEGFEGPPPRVVNSLHSQQSGVSGFDAFYDVPRLLLAVEVERLQLVQSQAQADRDDLKEAVEALDFKDEEIHRLQRLLDDEKINHKRTIEDLMNQTKEKNKSIETLSEGIKNLQMRVKEIERSRSQSPIAQKPTPEEEQTQLSSKITLAISGCLVPFFEQLKSQSHRQADDKSVKMCTDTVKQLENLQSTPIAVWKNESKRAVTTLGISLDSLTRSLEEHKLNQQRANQRVTADERSYLTPQQPQGNTQERYPRTESMERSVIIEEKIEMIDGQPTKVKYIKREPVRTRDNSWSQKTPERAEMSESKYSPSKPADTSAMGLALTQRLIEENCRIAEEFNKVKVQNKQLKEKVATLESKYQSETGSVATTAPGSLVGSTKRFDAQPHYQYGTRAESQLPTQSSGYYPARNHEDLY